MGLDTCTKNEQLIPCCGELYRILGDPIIDAHGKLHPVMPGIRTFQEMSIIRRTVVIIASSGRAHRTEKNVSIDGTWNIVIDTPMGKDESVLDIKSRGAEIFGTHTGRGGAYPVVESELKGSDVSWVTHVKRPFPLTLRFKGTFGEGVLSGKAKVGIFGTFSFQGKKS